LKTIFLSEFWTHSNHFQAAYGAPNVPPLATDNKSVTQSAQYIKQNERRQNRIQIKARKLVSRQDRLSTGSIETTRAST